MAQRVEVRQVEFGTLHRPPHELPALIDDLLTALVVLDQLRDGADGRARLGDDQRGELPAMST